MKTHVLHDEPEPAAVPPASAGAPGHRARRSTAPARGRALPLVLGAGAVLLALALLAGGAAALVALGERDPNGWFTSATHQLATSSHALVSEVDVDADTPGWPLGRDLMTARVEGASRRPVFLGVGATADVERYLAGVQHEQVTDVDTDPFTVSSRLQEGGGRPAAPAGQSFWRVQASGAGPQTISWPLEQGDWSAVAMNADGSRAVALDARFGAHIPALAWVAAGLVAAGGLALLVGAGLLAMGARSTRPPSPQV